MNKAVETALKYVGKREQPFSDADDLGKKTDL